MSDVPSAWRLAEVAREAHAAEASGESFVASEAWRRYRLIRDAARDPDVLLAEGIALSRIAIDLTHQYDRSGERLREHT
jgi:hypothetical protein